jgi:prepilin-type N-terminal cleavage/methylation domain-containing protein
MARRGFTMLETVLAIVIGGAVLLSALGLFSLMSRSETVLDRQFHQSRQLGTLQIVLRRTFNSLLMSEDSSEGLAPTDQETREQLGTGEIVETKDPAWDEDGNRPRILLEYDTSADLREMSRLVPAIPGDPMGVPQRLEMVLPRSPIPASLRVPVRGWAAQGVDLEAGREVYGISGSVRGVFELRPDGSREKYLRDMGMTPAGGERRRRDEMPGWTLWWRPIFPDEVARLEMQLPETSDDMLRAAAEGYPLIRGIKRCRILAFDNAYRKPVYAARTASDLPAFVEVEVETWTGLYANWMFEVGWLNGPDPTIFEEDTDDPDAPAGQPAPGAGGGANGGGTTTRGTGRDGRTRDSRNRLDRPALDRQRTDRPGSAPPRSRRPDGAARPGGGR